jgi:hypothetical protein
MERQSTESRNLEAHCKGGQGPPRAVAPSKKNKYITGFSFADLRELRHAWSAESLSSIR